MSRSVVLFLVSTFVAVCAVTVRETDGEIVYLNMRISVDALNAYLGRGGPLRADTWDGSAWLTVMVCRIEKLEMPLFGKWIPLPGSPLLVKTSAAVYRPMQDGTNHTGYLVCRRSGLTNSQPGCCACNALSDSVH